MKHNLVIETLDFLNQKIDAITAKSELLNELIQETEDSSIISLFNKKLDELDKELDFIEKKIDIEKKILKSQNIPIK